MAIPACKPSKTRVVHFLNGGSRAPKSNEIGAGEETVLKNARESEPTRSWTACMGYHHRSTLACTSGTSVQSLMARCAEMAKSARSYLARSLTALTYRPHPSSTEKAKVPTGVSPRLRSHPALTWTP